jgi:hypothetical protein
MIAAVLAAASILGAHGLSTTDPDHQALVVRSLGAVVVRFDADGYVQARGCDGRLRPIGTFAEQPPQIRIEKDGSVPGLVYHPNVEAVDRTLFERIMLAVGQSDWTTVAGSCLP